MQSLYHLIATVIEIYMFFVFAMVIMSWLVAFRVVNMQNRFIYLVYDVTNRVTEPALRSIRRFIPNLGGIDLSPLVLIVLLVFVKNLLREYWPR